MKQKSLDIAVSSNTSTTKAPASFILLKQKKQGLKASEIRLIEKGRQGKQLNGNTSPVSVYWKLLLQSNRSPLMFNSFQLFV